LLIPRYGLTGAGLGFAAGSIIQVVMLGSATLRSIRAPALERMEPVISAE
jgi:O-antigen/teichoic acid export membrane protein